jgi:beta-galactosidase/beta-glucuronidase
MADLVGTKHEFDQHDLLYEVANRSNPLPRSVSRREAFEILDGQWKFALDKEDRGLQEKWYVKHNYTVKAAFPGSLESYFAAVKDFKDESSSLYDDREEVIAWYEREFSIPEEWDRPNKLTQLTFGACGYETRVWLNGTQLETIEGEEIHYGEYNSFSYELPPELLKKENRLTVRVVDTLDADIPRGKQASRVYKQGGIWYQTISGAVRSVWLEPVGRNRLRSRLGVISSLRDRLVKFDFTTRIHDAGTYRLRLTATPHSNSNHDGFRPVTAEFDLTLEAGEHVQQVPLEMPNAKLWSPNAPHLYHLWAELISPDGTVTGIETHFGLRKISARGQRIYLNNEAIYLDGILYQPGISTFDEVRRHMLAMKRLGCNLVRVHIAGIDPRIYDLADEIGLMLWVEIPSPHSSTQMSRNNHWAELQRMLVFIASHPSIMILSLYNEDWGVEDITTSSRTRRYISDTFDYLRLNYPQLLVVDNDGWNHVSERGRLSSHLLTAHVYTPDPAAWASSLDRLVEGETHGVTAQPLIVGDPYFYRGQDPLVISEWGGFGFTNYGGPGETEEKADRIREFKREMRRRPIAGDIYTQATSIEEEVNGIIDPASGELLVPPGLLDSHSLVD